MQQHGYCALCSGHPTQISNYFTMPEKLSDPTRNTLPTQAAGCTTAKLYRYDRAGDTKNNVRPNTTQLCLKSSPYEKVQSSNPMTRAILRDRKMGQHFRRAPLARIRHSSHRSMVSIRGNLSTAGGDECMPSPAIPVLQWVS